MTDTSPRTQPSSRDLPLEPGGEIEIVLTSSGVRVRGTDDERVTVRTRDGSNLDDEVSIEGGPGGVTIRDAEHGFRLGPVRMRSHGGADLDIEIPRRARISFRTLSGDVEALDIAGESRWATASGELRLLVGGGSHRVESMSGDVTVEATAAIGLRARSVSGDLRIRAPRIDALGASTTSGDIRIDAALGDGGEHEVSSVSGDVELVTGSPVRVETQTIAGDVRATGAYAAEGGRGRRTIVAGDGSVRVTVRTTSGDIRLRSDGATTVAASADIARGVKPPERPVPPAAEPPVPPVAAEPPVPPLAPEPPYVVAEAEAAPNLVRPATGAAAEAGPWSGTESTTDRREAARLDILRALERGDLDIEAASHRLEQLDEAGPRSFRGWC